MNYYCARYQVLCLVDDGLPNTEVSCDYSFVLFQSDSKDSAFVRSIELAKDQETTYKNSDGNDVRWVVSEIEEIVNLGQDLNGIEVGNILTSFSLEKPTNFDTTFTLEKSRVYFDEDSKARLSKTMKD